jgi:lipoxygenase homology domain-containing protein 1
MHKKTSGWHLQDVFKLSGVDVGAIKSIKLWHDSSGLGPAWHVAQVTVFSHGTNLLYTFPCERWLAKSADNPEGNICSLQEGVSKQNTATYTVTVVTSDIRGAGTDGNIFVTVFGDRGSTGVLPAILVVLNTQACQVW